MAQAGQDVSKIVQAVKGSAHDEGQPVDPSLDVLTQRMAQLEQQQSLLALQAQAANDTAGTYKQMLAEMITAKEAAEEGLRMALEELQKLREAGPVSQQDIQGMVQELQKDARIQHEAKKTRWRKQIKEMSLGEVINATGEVIPLTINGLTAIIKPGKNLVPSAYVEAWNDHLEAESYAIGIDHQLRGSVEFTQLENIVWNQRNVAGLDVINFEMPGERAWDEDIGAA